MRIGIDARGLSINGGVQTYIQNLIDSLLKIDKENEYFIFYNNNIKLNRFPTSKEVVMPRWFQNFHLFWDYILLPQQLKKEGIDLVHNTKNAGSIIKLCKSVVTIHDIIPLLYPRTQTKLAYLYWRLQVPLVAKTADRIITVSESTKNDIINILGVDENKIDVIYEAPNSIYRHIDEEDSIEQIRQKYSLPSDFILYVGTLQPRKNVETIIKSFYKLKKFNHKLVIVGRKGWMYSSIFKLVKELNLENSIIFTGYVPDRDLPYVYNAADIFVYPSLYEGFGLPPLEAMACGTPVITSNTTSLPEVVGDAGIMVDPYDINGLAEAMYNVLTTDDLRNSMIKKGIERAKLFSWEKTAQETLKVYKKVCI